MPLSVPTRTLRSLQVSGWRQFQNVTLDFHPRLTVITGANGAGKTTLLNLLARHFGWKIPLATVPSALDRVTTYLTNAWHAIARLAGGRPGSTQPMLVIARITYDDGDGTGVMIPEDAKGHTYTFEYQSDGNQSERNVQGLYIPSHRSVFVPTVVPTPRSPIIPAEAYSRYSDAVRSAWVPNTKSSGTPLQHLKEALLSWQAAPAGPWRSYIDQFTKRLADVLPRALGFRSLSARTDEIVLHTSSGEFTLDAVSGGMAALIDLTWQIFLYSLTAVGRFVVLIDEPENHLHPELQRSVLYKLTQAFPEAQFIVTSHAPLVVTSVQDANVYALQFDDAALASHASGSGAGAVPAAQPARIVVAKPLHGLDRSGSANEILRNVLGLEYTMPVWAANIIDDAVSQAAASGYTKDALEELRSRLKANKLEQYGPEALVAVNQRYAGKREAPA
jgi:predicted ATPase